MGLQGRGESLIFIKVHVRRAAGVLIKDKTRNPWKILCGQLFPSRR